MGAALLAAPVIVYGLAVFELFVSLAGAVTPVLKARGTEDPAGETRTYPCISWCSAEQKSVQ